MPSTPTMKEADSRSAVVIDPEVVLAARADRAAAALGPDAIRRSPERQPPQMSPPSLSAPIPTVDPAYRPSELSETHPLESRSSVGTWVVRTGLAVAFAVCSAVAAAAWQSYGDQAQEVVGRWMPKISLLAPGDKGSSAPQPAAAQPTAGDEQATATAAPAQATDVSAPATASGATQGATTQAVSPESAQLLQSMAHDLTAMGQQIADLKASIAQLKASQDQMVQQMARAPEPKAAETKPFDPRAIEQTLRPRPAARPAGAPAVATVTPAHRPRPASPPPAQTFAPAPMALPSAPPPQASSDPGVDNVVRPPMPVR